MVANTLASALPHVLGLVLLNSVDYGHFSFAYLFYALGTSWLLSLACEPWVARPGALTSGFSDEYLSMVSLLAVASGGVAVGVAVWQVGFAVALVGGLSVAVNAAWFAYRFGLVLHARWSRVAILDLLTVAILGLGGVITWKTATGHVGLFVAWATAGAVGVVGSGYLRSPNPRAAWRWARSEKSEILRLFPESVLLDVGAIGVPLLMYPFMHAKEFGVYRAVSNVSFPVRIVLMVVRPLLARNARGFVRSKSKNFASIGLLVVVCLCAFAGIEFMARLVGPATVLAELRPFAGWAAAFVFVTGAGQLYYMCCRFTCSARELMNGRLAQTALVTVLPLGGLLWLGLEGAIGGFVVSAGASALLWFRYALASTVTGKGKRDDRKCADGRRVWREGSKRESSSA